jgi:hypothetical protein
MNLPEVIAEIEGLQQQALNSAELPQEGQVRSAVNELVAFKMSKLGTLAADCELDYVIASDELSYLREIKKVELMRKTDRSTGKSHTATKAESMVELDPDVREKLSQMRVLKHQHTILSNHSKSIWSWLEQSRSRLSWLGREVVHGS